MANIFTRTFDRIKKTIFPPKPPQDISVAGPDELEAKEKDFFESSKGKKAAAKTIKDYEGTELTMKQAYENAVSKDGPFHTFENLDKNLRNLAANKKICMVQDLIKSEDSPEGLADVLYQKGFLHDPALRLGIANMSKNGSEFAGKNSDFFKKVDGYLGNRVFEDTLAPVDPLTSVFDQDSLERNANSQKVMMKMMLMGQLGQSSIYKGGQKSDWSNKMTDMFLSGQRVGIILPGVEGSGPDSDKQREELISAIYGENRGMTAGNKKRGAATHNVELKSLEGQGDDKYKEIKVKPKNLNMHKALGNQYGMDIAAGGLGNSGPGGATINNNGTCGHMYSHIEKGDSKHHGALLVGFESEAPNKINQLGHSHKFSLTPKAELASCFGAQKNSTVGDSYGGREMDMSGMKPKDFIDVMQRFDDYVTKNQKDAFSPDKSIRQKANVNLHKVTQKLMGPPMSVADMSEFLNETCQYDNKKSRDMLSDSKNKQQIRLNQIETGTKENTMDTQEKSNAPAKTTGAPHREPEDFYDLLSKNIKTPPKPQGKTRSEGPKPPSPKAPQMGNP